MSNALSSPIPTNHDARFHVTRDGGRVRLEGSLGMGDAATIWKELDAATKGVQRGQDVALDLSGAKSVDGTIMAIVVETRAGLCARGVNAEITGASAELEPLVDLYAGRDQVEAPKKRKPESAVAQVGRATVAVLEEGKGVIDFLGGMVVALVGLVRRPRSGHLKEVPPLIEKAGADAVPIVILINFLVGFVMAYQSARQLKMFGANIFVADLVGISATRELAPLMTAIIVCGRSGAGFAAEIGSMKVSEELDALRTIGLGPFGWLVVPRAIALVFVVPLLTLIGDFISILGGLVVGVTSLDLTARGYFNETVKAVHGWDIGTGVIKSFVFAIAITLIACQQGFAASGGAEGVGKRTTGTVVSCLFALVILDAMFTVLFRTFDI